MPSQMKPVTASETPKAEKIRTRGMSVSLGAIAQSSAMIHPAVTENSVVHPVHSSVVIAAWRKLASL